MPSESVIKRSIKSTAYNITATSLQTIIQFTRSIILARLLAPEVFGVYAFAASLVLISRPLSNLGMTSALIHRSNDSNHEEALPTFYTISTVLNIVWFSVLILAGSFFTDSEGWLALVLIAATQFVDNLTVPVQIILIRQIQFRRIAVINTLNILIGAIIAVAMAYQGYGIYSLIVTDIIAALVAVAGYYFYKPIWTPKFAYSKSTARYLFNFGQKTFFTQLIDQALDRIDDLWSGFYLGKSALGYYSRAYTFATYPRRILAYPINTVAGGTLAELADNRSSLSKAFFRVNAFLVRSGFFLGGFLTLIAPEFIRILLGEKWLPMLLPFRLMLIFTLLDPLKTTIANLFIAVGAPEKTLQARIIQLIILSIGLFVFGPLWGISGVAIAVNLMLFTGIFILLRNSYLYVDYSVRKLFQAPAISLVMSILLARLAIMIPGIIGSPWRTGIVKSIIFVSVYCSILLVLEYKQTNDIVGILVAQFSMNKSTTANSK